MKSNRLLRRGPASALLVAGMFAASTLLASAQTKRNVEHFTATAINVTGAGDPLRIDLLRWSTEQEQDSLFSVLMAKGEKEFASELAKMPTLGYVWTSESAGYTVRYAHRISMPGGGERVIVAADKPLGSWNPYIWKPVASAASNSYGFTVIELRLNSRGAGEGKSSLFAKVVADSTAKIIALDNYTAAPVVLKDVKWQKSESP